MAQFELNGTTVECRDDHPHLLEALRSELGIISPKDGCSPTGQCGCCAVLLNGRARVACQVPLDKVEGASVVTLEGFDPAERDRYAGIFADHGALQCGFCIPGILVRAKALIDRKGADLSREEASRHLGGHLCRCTGYVKILDAVEDLAHGKEPALTQPGIVGSRGIRYEATDLACGFRPYIDDMTPDGCLHAAVRLADHARADVLRIDAAPALAVDGVEAVFTGADVPGELRVGIIHKDWPVFIPEGGRTSYLGDVLAIVVATEREIARHAAELIDIEYRPLEPITDPVAAVADAPDAVWQLDGNVLSVSKYDRRDRAGDFVPHHARVGEKRIVPAESVNIGTTNADRTRCNSDLVRRHGAVQPFDLDNARLDEDCRSHAIHLPIILSEVAGR